MEYAIKLQAFTKTTDYAHSFVGDLTGESVPSQAQSTCYTQPAFSGLCVALRDCLKIVISDVCIHRNITRASLVLSAFLIRTE